MSIRALPKRESPTSLPLRVAEEVRVLAARHKREGVNQTTLARVLGVTQSQVSQRMRGSISFTLAELDKLAWFFGVSPADLLGEDAKAPHLFELDEGPDAVRREGLEPPTRCVELLAELAEVVPFPLWRTGRSPSPVLPPNVIPLKRVPATVMKEAS